MPADSAPAPIPHTHTITAAAIAWLHQHLTDAGGSAPSAAIRQAGRRAGFSAGQIAEARRRLGIAVYTLPGWPRYTRWELSAPPSSSDAA